MYLKPDILSEAPGSLIASYASDKLESFGMNFKYESRSIRGLVFQDLALFGYILSQNSRLWQPIWVWPLKSTTLIVLVLLWFAYIHIIYIHTFYILYIYSCIGKVWVHVDSPRVCKLKLSYTIFSHIYILFFLVLFFYLDSLTFS